MRERSVAVSPPGVFAWQQRTLERRELNAVVTEVLSGQFANAEKNNYQ